MLLDSGAKPRDVPRKQWMLERVDRFNQCHAFLSRSRDGFLNQDVRPRPPLPTPDFLVKLERYHDGSYIRLHVHQHPRVVGVDPCPGVFTTRRLSSAETSATATSVV